VSQTQFVLRLDNTGGEGVELKNAYLRERTRDWSERQERAVESDVAEMFGDGRRNHSPIELELDFATDVPGRVAQARLIAALSAQLDRCVQLEFSPLAFTVDRARLVTLNAIEEGYRAVIRFYGPGHDFLDVDGTPIPLI